MQFTPSLQWLSDVKVVKTNFWTQFTPSFPTVFLLNYMIIL